MFRVTLQDRHNEDKPIEVAQREKSVNYTMPIWGTPPTTMHWTIFDRIGIFWFWL